MMPRAQLLAIGTRVCVGRRGRIDANHPHAAERHHDEQGDKYEIPRHGALNAPAPYVPRIHAVKRGT